MKIKSILLFIVAASMFFAGCSDMNSSVVPNPNPADLEGYIYTKSYNEDMFAGRVLYAGTRPAPDGYTAVEGAEVTLVDSPYAAQTTSSNGYFIFADIYAGTYSVRVEKDDTVSTFTVSVEENSTTIANDQVGDDQLTISPAVSGSLYASATVECPAYPVDIPVDATVYINGYTTGSSTYTEITGISPGSYSVTLVDADFVTPDAKTVTITADQRTDVEFEMAPADGNAPPGATITSPAQEASFTQGSTIVLTGVATDCEDGALSGGSLVWTSSEDGQIGTGTTETLNDLSLNTHIITLTATDSSGKTGKDTVTITITAADSGSGPTATILSPADGSEFSKSDTINFTGAGTDGEQGAITGENLVWSSSIDGEFSQTGTLVQKSDLSSGNHTITLTVTDSTGLTDTDTVDITVLDNNAPVVTITSPSAGTNYQPGAAIPFTATATDAEDGALSGDSLVWTLDGSTQIGTGTGFTKSDISSGIHTVSVTATDSDGNDTDALTVFFVSSVVFLKQDGE